MQERRDRGMTFIEILVVLAVLALLFSVTTHCWTSSIKKGQLTQTASNMRQLQLATLSAYLDYTGNQQPPAWPGDLDDSFSQWAGLLTKGYLSTNDFCKLLSAPGVAVPPGKLPTWKQSAIRVYAVRDDSPTNTLFLSTANFTNSPTGGAPLAKQAKPYGAERFVILQKSGEGKVLEPNAVGKTNTLGAFAPLCH